MAEHPAVETRWFDAEAWSVAASDVFMASTDDPQQWSDLSEKLRDSPLWTVPYFRVELILPTVENAYADYEERTGQR